MLRHRISIGIGLAAVASLGIAFIVIWAQRNPGSQTSAEQVADGALGPPAAGALPTLWSAPSFSYIDQNGRRFTDHDLRGHVWIADFFFTTCTSICPMMTAAMAELQRTIDNRNVELVSFSVDPEHDTPEVLARYALAWQADDRRWHFLSTDAKGLAATAAAMKVFVKPPGPDTPVQHSAVFLLVDTKGQVRGAYDSTDRETLARLASDALTLAGTPPPSSRVALSAWKLPQSNGPANAPGAALYVRCGCLACHAQAHVAPPLEGKFGSTVSLSDGQTARVDDAYIRESILDPGAKITAGYANMMPSYQGQLTPQELDDLVHYVESLGGSVAAAGAAPGEATARQVIDPVCGMEIDLAADTPRAKFGGTTYYFCSESCRAQFMKHPRKFLASVPPGVQAVSR